MPSRALTAILLALVSTATVRADDWWSLQPLTRPPVPAMAGNPIDAFLTAARAAHGLKPAPQADRVTLLRRVTFDLIGLPPTPGEIEAFLADHSPNAYEKVVDRLLASPAYGERYGRHWLDVAHYGDTHGFDKDKRRPNAWPYRDYVIRAFNQDKLYPRFIREQLAGDFLWPNDPDAVAATGFVAAGPWDFVGQVELREGTVEKQKTRVLDRDDMVASTTATFLSLTVHCARCHNHKFDPISQTDYYRLQSVFAGVERGDRPFPSPEYAKRRAELQHELQQQQRAAQDRLDAFNARFGPALARLDSEIQRLRAELAQLPMPTASPSPTNGYHSGIEAKPDATKWVQVDLGRSLPLDRIRLLPARPTDFPDTPGFGFPERFRVEVSDTADFSAAVPAADFTRADFPNPGDEPVSFALAGQRARFVRVTATRLWKRTGDYVFALAEMQVESGGRNVARGAPVSARDSIEAGRWSMHNLVDQCTSRRRLPEGPDPRMVLCDRLADARQARSSAVEALLSPTDRAERDRLSADLSRAERALKSVAPPQVYAIRSVAPRPVRVLKRGEVEKPGATALPGALPCVPGPNADFHLPASASDGARRAALAEWIADPRNPLTWRSMANRVWQWHFGKGLVDTPSDFGRNGSRPTHPQLLDWLACELRDHGSLKRLHRLIVTSAAYRQSSRHDAANARIDADNRYLWRMNRQRLDAEEMRDAVLAVSGRLDRTMGGPGFELFRFKDDHSPVYDYTAPGVLGHPGSERRTVYRFVVRSVPSPFLDCLDCADPNIAVPVRNTTLTALQALALLNDPFMVRQADAFAARLRQAATPADQVELAFRLALARRPTSDERAALVEYATRHGLANLCRLIFNLNEFEFID